MRCLALRLVSLFGLLATTTWSCYAGEQLLTSQKGDWLSPKQHVFLFNRELTWEATVVGEAPANRARWKLGFQNTVLAEGNLELDRSNEAIRIRFKCPAALKDKETQLNLLFQWQLAGNNSAETTQYQSRFELTILPHDVTEILGDPSNLPAILDSTGKIQGLLRRSGIDHTVLPSTYPTAKSIPTDCLLVNTDGLTSQSLNRIISRSTMRRIVVIGRQSSKLDLETTIHDISYGRDLTRFIQTHLRRCPQCLRELILLDGFSINCTPTNLALSYEKGPRWTWCVAGLKHNSVATELIFLPADSLDNWRDSPNARYLLASTLFIKD